MFNLAKDYFYDYNVITLRVHNTTQPVWANCYQANFSSLSDKTLVFADLAHTQIPRTMNARQWK